MRCPWGGPMEGQKRSGECSPLLCRRVSGGPQVSSRSTAALAWALLRVVPHLRPTLPAKGWRQNRDAGTWGGVMAPLLSSFRRQLRGPGGIWGREDSAAGWGVCRVCAVMTQPLAEGSAQLLTSPVTLARSLTLNLFTHL